MVKAEERGGYLGGKDHWIQVELCWSAVNFSAVKITASHILSLSLRREAARAGTHCTKCTRLVLTRSRCGGANHFGGSSSGSFTVCRCSLQHCDWLYIRLLQIFFCRLLHKPPDLFSVLNLRVKSRRATVWNLKRLLFLWPWFQSVWWFSRNTAEGNTLLRSSLCFFGASLTKSSGVGSMVGCWVFAWY